MREMGQRYIAALWDTAHSLDADSAAAAERLGGLVDSIAEAEAQLAGLRMHLLHEARLSAADGVIDAVKQSVRTTPAQAAGALKLSLDLGERFPLIATALQEGRISVPQADAIVTVLRKLPTRFTRDEVRRCEESILDQADTLGPGELRTLTQFLLELVDPDQAEADEAKRLAREERSAHRARYLSLAPDHHGSTRISGQLPVADAALLEAQLDALMPSAESYKKYGETPSTGARRADALVLLTQTAASTGTLPAHGGDRPTIHITLDYDTLTTGLGEIGLLGSSEVTGLSAGAARRLACDANLIPVVLGGESQPLDVGRDQRLVTAPIRVALEQRDGGCVFPGCTAPHAVCAAHHIIPWWAGGVTALSNLVLLCPFHHQLVEPDPLQSEESQWMVHLDEATGLPWVTPPRHIDPARRPRRHTRLKLRRLRATGPGAPPCPHPASGHVADPDPGPPGAVEVEFPETDPAELDSPGRGSRLEELIRRSDAIWHPDD